MICYFNFILNIYFIFKIIIIIYFYCGTIFTFLYSISIAFYYVELIGFDPLIKQEIYKLASIALCPNVIGQVMVDLMVRPPTVAEESYKLYKQERDEVYESLKR